MSASLDTNIVLRLLVRDIEVQYQLAKKLVESSTKSLQVADIVFVEIEYALINHYELSREQVTEILQKFISHPKINCNKELITKVLADYEVLPALSFTDISLYVYADLNSAKPLWTFDKKLANQGKNTKLLD